MAPPPPPPAPSLLGPPLLRHTNPKTPQKLPQNLTFPTLTPTLDLFFKPTANLDQNLVTHYVQQAWQHKPLTALKLIFNLSLVNRDVFFSAVEWLKENHLNTLSLNLQNFVRFGCLNVLPQLLNNWVLKKKVRMSRYHPPRPWPWPYSMKKKSVEKNNMEGDLRKDKHIITIRGKRAVKIYNSNSDYRYLFVCIADLFAKLLKSDIEYLKLGEIDKISMASKWCPSLDSLEDQRTLLCEGIARRVFPRDSDPEYKDIDEAHYAYRAQDRLQNEILVPLRKALVSAKRCESVPPKPALSDDMKKLYAEIFDKTIGFYCPGRNCDLPFSKIRENKYKAYLEIATLCVKASGPLLPNEIVVDLNNGVDSEVVECEWQRLVRHMKSKGRLKNCLAICDLSKNIGAIQMDLCASMGVLVSELSDEPWKGMAITCSHNPMLCKIEGDNLQSKIKFMKGQECDDNINFKMVYDLLLEFSMAEKLSPDRMVKTVFVFSYDFWGKEFSDKVFSHKEFTDKLFSHKDFTDKLFSHKGFQQEGNMVLPEIIFCDLGDASISVARKCERLAMIGVSVESLTALLEGNAHPSIEDLVKLVPAPEDLMESAISGEGYNDLIVFD